MCLVISGWLQARAQRTDNPWQIDLASGIQSFYAPVGHARFSRPEWVGLAGVGKPLGPRQQFAVTLQLGYARNNYQGDAVFLQLLGQYTPVIAEKVELSIGTGIGYRLGFYSNAASRYNGQEWVKGKSFKGMWQVPLQAGIGYRSIHIQNYQLRPYVACQFQALLGYSPDLSPFPVTSALIGLKIQNQ